jgi:hypothetical protein
LFYLAWKPDEEDGDDWTCEPGEGCFSNYHWGYYTDEIILICLLALGSPTHPVPVDVFYAWQRDWGEYAGHTLIQSVIGHNK